ncbi:MAG: hypothetical protein EOP04_25765 [Proteobacteria bacterium]|nr:MAG: hypothetical protein EOP04_25765 [Pseudomonadota bacterium]
MELFLASALNPSGGGQSSFTGLGGYVLYNLYGNCCMEQRTISVDGRPMITETTEKRSSLQVGLGLDQYFLNGSKSVYSASGLGIGLNYQFRFMKYNFKASYRHSQMTTGQLKIGGDFIGLGMVFSL